MKSVTCNGCFDELHAGHLVVLAFAKGAAMELSLSIGEYVEVVVGINTDEYIKRLKRSNPCTESKRIADLMATGLIDRAEVFCEDDPVEFIKRNNSMVHFMGEEYSHDPVNIKKRAGVRLGFIPRVGGFSSTAIKGGYEK